jgi:SAM-dependent methyltransferase
MFQNGTWNRTVPNIAVFDDVFIDDNVCSGLAVEPEHRQNLHELILGAQGVALNRQLQELVDRIEHHNAELRRRDAAIPAAGRGDLSIAEFCALPLRADIDRAIEQAERRLAAAQQQDRIANAPAFEEFEMPSFDVVAIGDLLARALPALDADAAARVRAHLAGLGADGEAWVADGMRRLTREDPPAAACPFCAQDLAASPVLAHYRAYFSDAYRELKRSVSETADAVALSHSGDVLIAFERWGRGVAESARFWAAFCDVPDVALETETIGRDWQAARQVVADALTTKQAAPLEAFALPNEQLVVLDRYEAHRRGVAAINARLHQANAAIRTVKDQGGRANAIALQADLARLRATRARHAVTVAPLCDAWVQEQVAKGVTERLRDQTRQQLNQHRAAIFPRCEVAINTFLERLNAGFRLTAVAPSNRGGPTCTYSIVVENVPVPVAGGAAGPGQPSFRNTLSAGDRNTLALAFFFASLDQDPALALKTVVIDDPISSLDEHRAVRTLQELRRLAERTGQVILLSHNKPFLCQVWENAEASARCALELRRDRQGISIGEWDVHRDCITEHDRRHAMLREYVATGAGDAPQVASAIRPVLESFIRVAYPEHFPPGSLLGPFVNVCGARLGTPHQILGVVDLTELRDLVEYANRFHHGANGAARIEAINDGELTQFVRRALDFATRRSAGAAVV